MADETRRMTSWRRRVYDEDVHVTRRLISHLSFRRAATRAVQPPSQRADVVDRVTTVARRLERAVGEWNEELELHDVKINCFDF